MLERAIGVGSFPDLQSAATDNAGLCYSQSNMCSHFLFAAAVLRMRFALKDGLLVQRARTEQSTAPFMTEKETVCHVKGGKRCLPLALAAVSAGCMVGGTS